MCCWRTTTLGHLTSGVKAPPLLLEAAMDAFLVEQATSIITTTTCSVCCVSVFVALSLVCSERLCLCGTVWLGPSSVPEAINPWGFLGSGERQQTQSRRFPVHFILFQLHCKLAHANRKGHSMSSSGSRTASPRSGSSSPMPWRRRVGEQATPKLGTDDLQA